MAERSVWRERDFRIAVAGRGVSAVGDGVTQLALLLHVHDSGAGTAGIALVLGVSALAVVVSAPWAGRLVDTLDSRVLAVAGSAVSAAAVLGLAAGGPLWLAMVLVFVVMSAQTVVGPTWGALTPRIVGPARAPVAVGWLQSVDNGARIAGPLLGGVLVGLGGTAVAFGADAVSYAVIAAAACLIRTRRHPAAESRVARPAMAGLRGSGDPPPESRGSEPGAGSGRTAGLAVLRGDALLWPLVIALTVFIVGAEAANVLDVFLIRDALHASSRSYGLVSAIVGAGLLLGSLAATRLRTPRQRVRTLLVNLAVIEVLVVAEGLAPTLAVLAVLTAVTGVSNGLINAAFGGILVERVPDAARGRAGSALNALTRTASVLALALGALVGALTGPRTGFVVLGTGTIVLLLGIVPWTLSRLRRADRAADRAADADVPAPVGVAVATPAPVVAPAAVGEATVPADRRRSAAAGAVQQLGE